MRAIWCEIALGVVMIVLGTAPGAFGQAADEVSKIVGTWRGDSVCIAKNTACHDEDVVYRVTKLLRRLRAMGRAWCCRWMDGFWL